MVLIKPTDLKRFVQIKMILLGSLVHSMALSAGYISFHHPVFMRILKYRIRNEDMETWKCQIKKNIYISLNSQKNLVCFLEVVFDMWGKYFMQITGNGNAFAE